MPNLFFLVDYTPSTRASKTLEEVTRLEEALTSGVVPSDLKLGPE